MASDTPLWKAHDISQALQDKLEEMAQVERGEYLCYYISALISADHLGVLQPLFTSTMRRATSPSIARNSETTS